MKRFCIRCDQHVEAEYDEPEMRKFARIYFLCGIPLIPAMPFIGADFAVLTPLFAVYVFGVGTAMRYIRQIPVCSTCGCETQSDAPVDAPVEAPAEVTAA